jgi:thiol-disulfide isomerase/thioredoxin
MEKCFMRSHLLVAFAAVCLVVSPSLASETKPFTQAAFDAAQAAGKPILVDIHAWWCPICAKQAPTLEKLQSSTELGDLTVFKVDFDSQKDVVHQFGAQMQSTLIVFHGKTEKGRSTGMTDPQKIHDLLLQAKN